MKSLFKICIIIIVQSYDTIHGEHPKLTALKNSKNGHFGLVGFRQVVNASGDYIENVLGDKIKFNESIHSWHNISYKYLTECDVKYPLNKFLFTTTNQYERNTYRKRFFQQDSREEMFTKKYEAKYAKMRASSTARTTRFTKAPNIFDSKMMWDNLLEQYPDIREVMVTLKPWPRKLWTGTYPPVEPKVHPNMTTPEDWSLDIRKTYSEEDYQGPDRRLDPKDSISAYGMSLAKEKVHYDDEYNSQVLPELERQWKIRGDKKNIEAGLDRPSADHDDPRMYRPGATHYLAGCKIDMNHYRPFETMNQTLNPYLPYNEFYLRTDFDPAAWHRTVRELHWEIDPDSELSDPELRKKFTIGDSEDYGDKTTPIRNPEEEEEEEDGKEEDSYDGLGDDLNSADYYNSEIYADSMLNTAELAEKKRRKLLKANLTKIKKKKTTPKFKRKFSLVKTQEPKTSMSSEEIARRMKDIYDEDMRKTIPTTKKPYNPDDSGPIHPMLRQKEILHKKYPGVSQFQLQELNELDELYVREKDILNCSSFTISMKNLRNIERRHNLKISELPPVSMIYWVHPNRTAFTMEQTSHMTTHPMTDYIVTESIETYMNMTPFNIENIKNIERKFNFYLNDSNLVTEIPDSIVRINDFITVRHDGSNDYHDLLNYYSPLKRRKRALLNELTSLLSIRKIINHNPDLKKLTQSDKIVTFRNKKNIRNKRSASKESNMKRWKKQEDLTKVREDTTGGNRIEKSESCNDFHYSEDEDVEDPEKKKYEKQEEQKDDTKKGEGSFINQNRFNMDNIKNMDTNELKKLRDYQEDHPSEIEKYLRENRDFIYEHQESIFDEEQKKLAVKIQKKLGEHDKIKESPIIRTPEITTEDLVLVNKRKENEKRDRAINEAIYKLSNIRNRMGPLPGDIVDYYHIKLGWVQTEPPPPPPEPSEEIGKPKKKMRDGKIDPFEPYFKLPSVENNFYIFPETTTIMPLNFGNMNRSQIEQGILKYGIEHMIKLSRQKTTMSYKEFKLKRLLEGRKRVKGEIRPREKSNKEKINAIFDGNWKVKDLRLKRRKHSRKEKIEKQKIDRIPFYVQQRAKDQRARKRIFDKKVVLKIDPAAGEVITQKVTVKRPVGPLHYHVKKKKGEILDGEEFVKLNLLKGQTTTTRKPYDPDHESEYSEEDRPVNKGVDFKTSEEENSKYLKKSVAKVSSNKLKEKDSESKDESVEKDKMEQIKRGEDYASFDYKEKKKKNNDPNMDEIDIVKGLTFHSCGSIKETAEIEEKARKLMKGFRKRKHRMFLRRKHAKYYNLTDKSLMSSESDSASVLEPIGNANEKTPQKRFRYIKEYDGSKVCYEKEYLDSNGNPIPDSKVHRKIGIYEKEKSSREYNSQSVDKAPETNFKIKNENDLEIPDIDNERYHSDEKTTESDDENNPKSSKRNLQRNKRNVKFKETKNVIDGTFQQGIFGNVKISIDVLMKSIMNNKKSGHWCRNRRNVITGATEAVTEYAGKVEDPHSNCCQNEESREEFRRALAKLKIKKFKQHLDDIQPPKVKITEATTAPVTVKTPCTGEAKTRVRRNKDDLEDLYPSVANSGDSHNLRKFGIQHDDRTVTLPKSTRWHTTPKIMNLFNMTKSNLIKDVEKRFSLDVDKLTTPFTFKWSPYGLVITDSEQLDSDSELEVMDWYEERESPTYTTLPPTTDPFNTDTEPTLYDYDGMTKFNIENIRNIEKKFNVSLKNLANRTDNMRIRAKTLGYGLHGAKEWMKNFPTDETLLDKHEPDFKPIFPTDWGFFHPNGTQIEEYGNRDWVLKDILEKWRQQINGSFETVHREAENMTWEIKRKEFARKGIPWNPPVRLLEKTQRPTERNNWYTGCTWNPRDERFMDEHFKHVDYVNEYNRKHDLFPFTGKTSHETTLDPESAECQQTIMDWIMRGWTESHENKHSSHKKRNKRDTTNTTKYNIKIDFNENVTGSGHLIVNPDYLQTFNDPVEFGEAVRQLYGDNATVLGREDMMKKIKELEQEKGTKREKRQINGITPYVPKRRLKRDMPYLGYSGLSSRIIFEWTNYPYFKTKQPFQIRREKIQAKHNPTNDWGARIHIKKKWTIFTTKEPAQQSFKWVDGIPVREKLDYNDMMTVPVPGRLKREVGDFTDLASYEDTVTRSGLHARPDNTNQSTEGSGGNNETNNSEESYGPVKLNETEANISTVHPSVLYSNSNENLHRRFVKRDIINQDWQVIRKAKFTKSRGILNLEKRFGIDIDKITTKEPFNMTLLLEIMSKIVYTYADTEAPTTTEPPKPSVVKFRTVYSRQKRNIDRFMDYVADPIVQTNDHLADTDGKPHDKQHVDNMRKAVMEESMQDSGLVNDDRKHLLKGDKGDPFKRIVFHDQEVGVLDRLKRYVDDKVNKAEQDVPITESWLKRRKRDMPYLGYSGLSSRIIFEWTNYPYFKTKQPFQIRREKIQAKHNPTNDWGARIHIKKKWTIFTTKEPAQQSFKWVDGIPVREKLDYNDMMTVPVPGRLKRDVNDGTTTIGATFETPTTPETTLHSDKTTSSSVATSQSTVAETTFSNVVNGTQAVLGVNASIISSTQNSSTPISLLNATTDNDSLAANSKLINSVHTLGRKKRALAPHKRKKRLKGQVLFEKIIQAYFNCKNVWKEPDAPEILQIRRRYREQKNRPLDRIFGRRSHNHVDIYYDGK